MPAKERKEEGKKEGTLIASTSALSFSSRGKPLCLACVEEAPHRFCDAIALKSDSSTVILHLFFFFLLAISLSSVHGFAPFLLHLFFPYDSKGILLTKILQLSVIC